MFCNIKRQYIHIYSSNNIFLDIVYDFLKTKRTKCEDSNLSKKRKKCMITDMII